MAMVDVDQECSVDILALIDAIWRMDWSIRW